MSRLNWRVVTGDSLPQAHWRWAGIVVAGFLLGVSYVVGTTSIGYDGQQYLTYARNLLATASFTYDGVQPSCGRAPGYPAFLALFLQFFGSIDWVYPSQFALLLVVYGLVAHSFESRPRRVALTLVLLSAVWPLHQLARDLLSEPLFIVATSAGLYLFHRHLMTGKPLPLFGAGLFLGLSALVRPVNLLATPFLALILLWRRKLSLRQAILVTSVSVLAVVPWTARNWALFGKLVPIAAHHGSIYYMTDAEVFWPVLLRSAGYTHSLPIHRKIVGDDLELDWKANERYWEYARSNIEADPWGFLGRCTMKTLFIWTYLPGTKAWVFSAPWAFAVGVATQLVFLFAAARGMWIQSRTDPSLPLIVTGYAAYTAVVLFPFYAESRMLLPVHIWLFGSAARWLGNRYLK